MNTLNGRTALVTGSSRGIGAAIATLFAAEGARVVVHGRDADAAADVHRRIEAAGGESCYLTADLTGSPAVEEMRERIEERFGPVDVVVANAGGSPVPPGPLEELSEQDWRASVDTNLTATFLTVKSFLPGMKQRGYGSIVTMSSAAARRPSARSPVAYTAAKAGIELLTQALATQAGPHGVRVNCIAPETIVTERTGRLIPEEMQRTLAQEHPIQRLGTPDDVAKAALYLASDDASWVSGIVLDVAGGSVLA